MAFTTYSAEFQKEKTSRSQGHELHVSPKHCVEICRELRGKSLAEGKSYLEAVTKMETCLRRKKPPVHRGMNCTYRLNIAWKSAGSCVESLSQRVNPIWKRLRRWRRRYLSSAIIRE